ncbi:MarR family winged helix-turn-helix transcriptional regulator [Prosthecomicrobium pneumaticum]|uniref:MarR family transcriptional regulator for hemolysin n=1 Tax=Prosthecomicrobium pneumaticum TaxID=81895 RepID=A0A7W9FKM8_9HYPH|nr:MarR family transcriptional regulator [Prosthecomicrobium pneumaticum]MBB5752755.1 MarR family transcriptional regulator for hemolysin [Prosthecomicrobium pneumaticum]
MSPPEATETERALQAGFGALVAQTARLWRRAVDRELQPFGLTEATWLPLLRLSRAARPMRQKDLAASLSLDGSSVVRLIDALAAAGLVERREDEEDRRARTIVLTAAGRETVAPVEAVAARVRRTLLADIPDEDLAAAARTLERINRVLERGEEEAA